MSKVRWDDACFAAMSVSLTPIRSRIYHFFLKGNIDSEPNDGENYAAKIATPLP